MSGNTMRGTPGRGQSRGGIPFNNSPSTSAIPRPVLETQDSSKLSDVGAPVGGGSTLSASRQKQTKRDEVCSC